MKQRSSRLGLVWAYCLLALSLATLPVQAGEQTLVQTDLGQADIFSLSTPVAEFMASLQRTDTGEFRSRDGKFLLRVDSRGRISEIEVLDDGLLTERFVRKGHSSLQQVLDRYGSPSEVSLDGGNLELGYEGVVFTFQVPEETGSPVHRTNEDTDRLLRQVVEGIKLIRKAGEDSQTDP